MNNTALICPYSLSVLFVTILFMTTSSPNISSSSEIDVDHVDDIPLYLTKLQYSPWINNNGSRYLQHITCAFFPRAHCILIMLKLLINLTFLFA